MFVGWVSHLDVLQHRHNKDIQVRVPPSHNDAGSIGPRDALGPEDAHQAIMIWHDRQLSSRAVCVVRTSPSSSIVLAPTRWFRGIEDATVWLARYQWEDWCGRQQSWIRTRLASRVASCRTGTMRTAKKRLRSAKPLAARAYNKGSTWSERLAASSAGRDRTRTTTPYSHAKMASS